MVWRGVLQNLIESRDTNFLQLLAAQATEVDEELFRAVEMTKDYNPPSQGELMHGADFLHQHDARIDFFDGSNGNEQRLILYNEADLYDDESVRQINTAEELSTRLLELSTMLKEFGKIKLKLSNKHTFLVNDNSNHTSLCVVTHTML